MMETNEYIKDLRVLQDPNQKSLTKTSETVKKDLPKYWHAEEIKQKIDTIKNPEHQMLCKFLWMSGCRITEALSLKKKDIDLQNYTLTVRWLKSRKYKERNLPMHPLLRDLLQIYTATKNLETLVFPISRQRAWQILQKNLDGGPHKLRHSFAVHWLRCGGDIVALHRILGHSNIQTTMIYLQIVPIDTGKELIKLHY